MDWRRHPAALQGKGHHEVEELIFHAAVDKNVLVSRGSWFLADNSVEETGMFFRATFAAAPADQIDEAIQRLGTALRAEFNVQ